MSIAASPPRAQLRTRVPTSVARLLLPLGLLLAAACGNKPASEPANLGERSAALLQTCTVQATSGAPVKGVVCGGSSHGTQCSPGVLYQCDDKTTTNNCTLSQSCSIACITVPGSSLNDQCWTGTAPVQLSTQSTLGGNTVTATVTLTEAHTGTAIDNFKVDRGDLVGAVTSCNVLDLPAGVSSVSFGLPTAVVSSTVTANVYTDLAYTDTSGNSRQLVSVARALTLNPGGTAPPTPAVASFTLSPSTLNPNGDSFMNATLASMAPMPNVPVTVTSSDPTIASVISGGQPVIQGGCTTGGGAATLVAARSVAQTTTITVSASSISTQTPVTNPLTVNAGCAPLGCSDVSGCGNFSDGCGGTLTCNCPSGETCNSGVCTTTASIAVASLSLSPTSVTGGSSSTGTVTMNMAAPSGGVAVFLSSSSASATVPSSIVIPQGQTTGTFTVSTTRVSSNTSATITASSNGSQTAVLTLTP